MAWDFVSTPRGLLPNQSQARLPALCSAHHAWVLEGVKLSKVCGKHFSLEEKGKLLNADQKKNAFQENVEVYSRHWRWES